jgi:hypothetical protein
MTMGFAGPPSGWPGMSDLIYYESRVSTNRGSPRIEDFWFGRWFGWFKLVRPAATTAHVGSGRRAHRTR